ncbi:MAG: hypothetical protein ABSC92_15085 [Rhizomicrobium sp.]
MADAIKDERALVEVCDLCEIILHKGDLATPDNEGGYYCEKCAPTWAQIYDWAKSVDPNDEPDAAASLEGYEVHIAAGGSPNDKPLIRFTGL